MKGLLGLLGGFLLGLSTSSGAELTVPNGFTMTKVAGSPDISYPMFATFDDRGNLYVAESSGLDLYAELQKLTRRCRISRLRDADGDGVYEHRTVFAEQLVFPMGLVWSTDAGGRLYVADPPDLITLEDSDGDGRADRRTVILTGFGHLDNGSLHGLTFGPDGWLYMTMGQPDGYRLRRDDGSILSGKSGALLRCRPDGSKVEVVSRGFENLVEVVFLPGGEIIGTDNWFRLPAAGVRDALVHLLEGGLYPLQLLDKGTQFLFTGEALPALSLYPAVALSGLVRYRGSSFPLSYRECLYSAQHNTRKIGRHRLVPRSSTFVSEDDDFVTTDDPDFHPSDVLEDADGSLVVVDTGSWYIHHCPTGQIREAPAKGGIYRVRFAAAAALPDPWGLKFSTSNSKQAAQGLRDERVEVQQRAGEVLVRAGSAAVDSLISTLLDEAAPATGRETAMWSLSRIVPRRLAELMPQLSKATNDALTAAASRALGRSGEVVAEPVLRSLLTHASPHVRLAASEALAHCGSTASVPALQEALTKQPDPHLEHAFIFALSRLANSDHLIASLESTNARLRQMALLLWEQTPSNGLEASTVTRHLFADDSRLRRAALWVLQRHPTWVATVLEALRPRMQRAAVDAAADEWSGESLRELAAAFRGRPEMRAFLAEVVSSRDFADAGRRIAIECMASGDGRRVPEGWTMALRGVLSNASPMLQLEALRAVAALQIRGVDEFISGIVHDEQKPASLRSAALFAQVQNDPKLSPREFRFLRSQLEASPPATRLAAGEIVRRAHLESEQLDRIIEIASRDQLISPATILAAARRSDLSPAKLREQLVAFLNLAIEGGRQFSQEDFEWLQRALPTASQPAVKALVDKWQTRQGEALRQFAQGQRLLQGGNRDRGRIVFFGKAACASCHQAEGQGGVVGPDLSRIGSIRAGRDLLESTLMPSASFAQGYDTYYVTTSDGEELSGIRLRAHDEQEFLLRDAAGGEHRLPPARLKTVTRANVSLMPEGLLSVLSEDEVRDLFAFLQGLK